jgi:hypothetical protein
MTEKILDLLPVPLDGKQRADEGCHQDLKNKAASTRVQVGKGIL